MQANSSSRTKRVYERDIQKRSFLIACGRMISSPTEKKLKYCDIFCYGIEPAVKNLLLQS